MPNRGETQIELLLVEDDADDAKYIERLLYEFGTVPKADRMIEITEIEHAGRLSETLELFDSLTPDVVLLDLSLPDSRGLETVERVIEHAPDVPIVVVTGSADTGLGAEAIKLGAQDYLRKGSITEELLRRTLRYAIDRHERTREIAATNRRLRLLNGILRRNIRNDASMIVGWGDELRGHVDEEGREILEALLETAHHVVERTDTVAEGVEALSTEREEAREPTDLRAAVDAAVERIRGRNEVDLTVEYRGEGDGEHGDDRPMLVEANPMLSTAFEQLLSNAVRHNDHEVPQVTVTVEESLETASVSIVDDGIGIPDTRKELLADLDGGPEDHAGMGTGLYLVLAVLDRIGAVIEVTDNRPHGTVVTVTLDRTEPV